MLKKGKTLKAEETTLDDDKKTPKKNGSVSPRPSRPASATTSTVSAIPASAKPTVVEEQRPSTSTAAVMVQSADRLRPTPTNLSQRPNITRTLISGSYMGTGKSTPTVVRTTSPTTELGDEEPVSIEQQFYYLRLMAKPGSKPEPIKMKFVRWAPTEEAQLSVDDEGVLDNQAMRVVRTIGQAFEVCHKNAQEQMVEKQHLEDSESTSNLRVKAIAEEEEEPEKTIRKNSEAVNVEAEAEDIGSRGSSPAQPPTGLQMKRHSIYTPRKYSSDVSSQGTAIEQGGAIAAAAAAAAAAAVSFATHSAQGGQPEPSNPSNIPPNASTSGTAYIPSSGMGGVTNPGMPGTSTLPHSHTWNPNYPQANPQYGPQIGAFPSMQSLDTAAAAAIQGGYRYYPMPSMMPASASMPYGLSSPVVVSPYATLQLPNAAALAAASAAASGAEPGDVAAALQITRSLDQYNQQVIRSQLDQAHQSAQVASCQVQLLRDQLTSETTARLEAQSRTHQLLNSNRELLEHVQALVTRLQTLETRLTSDIHSPQQQPAQQQYQSATLPATTSQQPQQQFTYSPAGSAKTATNYSSGMGQQQDSRLPGPAPVNPQRPYQMQTLAELRAGSLPPVEQQTASGFGFGSGGSNCKKNKGSGRRFQDDSGVRTEPDSATEDTTDYSSSDQYEKITNILIKKDQEPTTSATISRANTTFMEPTSSQPHYDVLLSNPQVMHNLSSYFQSSMQPFMQPPSQSTHNVVSSVSQPQPMIAQPLMPRRSSHKPRQSIPYDAQQADAGPAVPRHHYHRQPSPPHQLQQQQFVTQPLPPSVPLGGIATPSTAQGAPVPARQTSPKKTTRRLSLQPNTMRDEEGGDEQSDTSPSKSKKCAAKGIFKEKDVGFSRMSFNTRINPNKKADINLINVPPSSSAINEEDDYPPGFNKDERRRSSDGSRRKSLGAGQARTSISRGASPPARHLDLSGLTEKQRKKEAIAAAAAATSGIVHRAPASSSIATAMYPPVKKSNHSYANKPSPDSVKRGGFQALSIELDDPHVVPIVPAQAAPHSILSAAEVAAIATAAAISATSGPRAAVRQSIPPGNYYQQANQPVLSSALDRVMRSQQQQFSSQSYSPPTSNANYSTPRRKMNEINMNTDGNAYQTYRPLDAPMFSNNNNNRLLPDPDSVKGRTLLAMDAKKLSDPVLLARLTGHYAAQRKDSEGNNLPNGVP